MKQQCYVMIVTMTSLVGISNATAVPSGYDLVFADEFHAGALDQMKWGYNYSWGNYHNHNAVMSAAQVSVADDNLVINAVHGTPGWAKSTHTHGGRNYAIDYTSGAVHTAGTLRIDEGFIEARMKMPNQEGSWPAFWMLGNGWPPEIDIQEYPLGPGANTNDNRYYTNYFYGTQAQGPPSNGSYFNTGTDLGASFNTFSLKWVKDVSMEFYFNGTRVKSEFRQNVVDDFVNMYLILNYAVGGWPDAPSNPSAFNDTFEVDWVRVWQASETKDTRLLDPQSDGISEWGATSSWTNGAPTQGSQIARMGTQNTATQIVEWDNLRNIGSIYFDGDTDYTLGDGNESLTLAQGSNTTSWSRIWLDDGDGSHVINSRLDLWTSTSIRNYRSGSLTFNGDLISQARDGGESEGVLMFRGPGTGQMIINGLFRQQRRTTLNDGAQVVVNSRFFHANNLFDDAKLEVLQGSTITLDGLNVVGLAGEGISDPSLGYLGPENTKLILNDGTVVLRGSTSTFRGFTIGSAGATIISNPGADVRFLQSALPEKGIDTDAGGDLTLGGDGDGTFDKVLSGTGGLYKIGTGTWSIGANNSYTGPTYIHSGTVVVNGTTGQGATTVTQGAALSGSGTVSGDLVVTGGSIEPGSSAGIITVIGNYNASSESILTIELSTAAGGHDSLLILGSATLAGALNVDLLSGYVPTLGDSFGFLTAFGGVVGGFNSINLPDVSGLGLDWLLNQSSTTLTLEVVSSDVFGDLNNDGFVGIDDLNIVLSSWNKDVPPGNPLADANGDGFVGIDDLNTVLGNWNTGAPPTSVDIPEPAISWLVNVGILSMLHNRKRRR